MKKINICMFAMLLAMTVFVLTACSTNKDSGKDQTTSPGTTTQSTTSSQRETTGASTGGTSGTQSDSSSDDQELVCNCVHNNISSALSCCIGISHFYYICWIRISQGNS